MKRLFVLLVLCVVSAVIFYGNRLGAEERITGNVEGYVRSLEDGSPIAGAAVKVGEQETTSDEKGFYSLPADVGEEKLTFKYKIGVFNNKMEFGDKLSTVAGYVIMVEKEGYKNYSGPIFSYVGEEQFKTWAHKEKGWAYLDDVLLAPEGGEKESATDIKYNYFDDITVDPQPVRPKESFRVTAKYVLAPEDERNPHKGLKLEAKCDGVANPALLADDGRNGDGEAGDFVWGATLGVGKKVVPGEYECYFDVYRKWKVLGSSTDPMPYGRRFRQSFTVVVGER